jgi:chromosome segregation ATPase
MKIYALACTVLMLPAASAFAQTERSGNPDARVVQQLQQLTGERAALQAENATLKQELAQAKKQEQKVSAEKSALENRQRALQASASRDDTSGKQTQEQLERSRAQLQELIAKFRDTAQTLRDIETQRAALQNELTMQERAVKTCVDRNAGLYNLNVEVLDRMDNQGLWSSLAQREPFTKLKRVQLENLIDDYKYRAEELRLEQQQASSAK